MRARAAEDVVRVAPEQVRRDAEPAGTADHSEISEVPQAVPGLLRTPADRSARSLRRTIMVGAADDACERDAEHTATQVVAYLRSTAGSDPESVGPWSMPSALRRLGSTGTGTADSGRSAAAGLEGGPLEADLDHEIASTRGRGDRLPAELRSPLEGAFGADFGAVRLHTGEQSGRLNRQIGARAFTVGADIYLGRSLSSMPADDALHLLGHELTHTIQQGAAPTRTPGEAPGPGTAVGVGAGSAHRSIQRDVGIEFEFAGIKTTSKQAITGTHQDLKRKQPILTGVDFALEADDLETYSDAEFVTAAFPETPAGGARLVAALIAISHLISLIEAQQQNVPVSAATLQGAVPGTNAVPNRWLERTLAAPLVGKPQVTAGVRMNALDELFRQVSLTAGAPGVGNEAATFFGGQMGPNAGSADGLAQNTGIPDVGRVRGQVGPAIAALNMTDPGAAVLINDPALRALLTQLALYLGNGAVGSPGYGKLIAGSFMSRTNFAAMFSQLAGPIQAFFTGAPQKFVDLAIDVAWFAKPPGYGGVLRPDGPIFEGGIYNDVAMYGLSDKFQSGMPTLTRQAWLAGIVAGQDLMTSAMYPARWWEKKKVTEEMQGLGSYGANMDALPTPGGPAPIVEFRGLKPIFGHLLMPMALDVYRYVHALNTAGAAVFPGEMLGLGMGDRMDLITNQANAVGVRAQIIQNATADFQNW